MSLRTKIILALLLTSLASVGLVGGVAYAELMRKFDTNMLHGAFERFRGDVKAYVRAYGSWEEAEHHEPFAVFVARRMSANGGPPPMFGDHRPPRNTSPPSQAIRQPGAIPPPGLRDRPPFQFILFNPAGKILLPNPSYRVGDTVKEKDRRHATPILLNDRVVAYASPHGIATLSAEDLNYLHAMRTALIYGVVSATALALLLGILFGNTLSRALRRLTYAIQSMGGGALHQHVEIESRDEVGLLAGALNQMSEDLAKSHEKLEQSNLTIRRQAERLEELSIRDFLTELYNRRHFDEQAVRLFAHARRYEHPLSVMIGDIDLFKGINDRFSHAVGDLVLKQVADILRKNARVTDLVARYGGEEFVIALPETPLTQAVAICERLRRHIESHDWAEIHPDMKVTISIGVSADAGAASLEAMLQEADRRLYQAKQGGRNRVCPAPNRTVAPA